jgi:hypothetical protein
MIWVYIAAWIIFMGFLVHGMCLAAKKGDDREFIERQNELMRLALERNNHEK